MKYLVYNVDSRMFPCRMTSLALCLKRSQCWTKLKVIQTPFGWSTTFHCMILWRSLWNDLWTVKICLIFLLNKHLWCLRSTLVKWWNNWAASFLRWKKRMSYTEISNLRTFWWILIMIKWNSLILVSPQHVLPAKRLQSFVVSNC